MPAIYDNIETDLLDGLRETLKGARRADFCTGYFNLRGWGKIAEDVENLRGEKLRDEDEKTTYCRLLIGMNPAPPDIVRAAYGANQNEITQSAAYKIMKEQVADFAKQLTFGRPTAAAEKDLRTLARQLRGGKLRVKFHGRRPLHAKLYLVRREDNIAAVAGFVGSSNLTFAGLEKNYELNVDVLEQDAANKLAQWFEARWEDDWSADISEELAKIIEESWAGGPVKPYYIYLKTAYELSLDAISGVNEYPLPAVFRGEMLKFQERAVGIAAKILHKQGGVIIGDVVGLGKTITASAVAKTFQEDHGDNVLIVCPPKLEKMWGDYLHRYRISGDTFSHGKTAKLEKERRYKLLIIDESHNFRNRESDRYTHLRDYINNNESRVILLTATPYNKSFHDIANQLRLFVSEDLDLGIRPDKYIQTLGGAAEFKRKHPQTPVSALPAFEKSEEIDDWRELMRRYLVRRTRGHIIQHDAKEDKTEERHYLDMPDGKRFYFPKRTPKTMKFRLDKNDDYGKLYSEEVVGVIGELELPRYGLQQYFSEDAEVAKEDEIIIENLSRAGRRLRGFARSNLFKRLESGGDTFLKSIRRHIVRNAVFIAALEDKNGALPVGQIYAAETDEALDEADSDLFAENEETPDGGNLQTAANEVYQKLRADKKLRDKFQWPGKKYFNEDLRAALKDDIGRLQTILAKVPEWKPEKDRKLEALAKLLLETHKGDKILIFTQYKDTADYLLRELQNRKMQNIAAAHGDSDVQSIVNRFSPVSNGKTAQLDDFRVLVATDVLSEGQNLQDAHIVVNYDLPWALIRLVQRAGRVDRIGQKSPDIFCYSALPADGVEKVISLRKRLRSRIGENRELVGTDERFFEDDPKTADKTLRDLYAETAELEETEDETDLLSRAFDIWQNAVKDRPGLEETIKKLPNVVYSAKPAKPGETGGAIAYIKDGGGNDILAHVDTEGAVISQSQSHLLDLLQCEEEQEIARPAAHHELTGKAAEYMENIGHDLGGQLGGNRSVRRRIYARLNGMLANNAAPLLRHTEELKSAVQEIYDRPLTETARGRIRRMLMDGTADEDLCKSVLEMRAGKILCAAEGARDSEPKIICSMGLVK